MNTRPACGVFGRYQGGPEYLVIAGSMTSDQTWHFDFKVGVLKQLEAKRPFMRAHTSGVGIGGIASLDKFLRKIVWFSFATLKWTTIPTKNEILGLPSLAMVQYNSNLCL